MHGLAVVLAALMVFAGRVQLPLLGSIVLTLAMTACFSVTGATDPAGDGLWPIGAFLVCIGCATSSLVVSYLAAYLTAEPRGLS